MSKKPENNARIPAEAEAIAPTTREKVRIAIATLERAGAELNVRSLRAAAQCDQGAVSTLLRLYRAGELPPVTESWGPPGAPAPRGVAPGRQPAVPSAPGCPDLEASIRGAKDLEQLSAVVTEVMARVASGQLELDVAKLLKEIAHEKRLTLVAVADAPKASPVGELLCTPQAAELVAMFESVVNGRRRAAVVTFLRGQATEDARDFPGDAAPERVRAKLEDLGLDAFGEPT